MLWTAPGAVGLYPSNWAHAKRPPRGHRPRASRFHVSRDGSARALERSQCGAARLTRSLLPPVLRRMWQRPLVFEHHGQVADVDVASARRTSQEVLGLVCHLAVDTLADDLPAPEAFAFRHRCSRVEPP